MEIEIDPEIDQAYSRDLRRPRVAGIGRGGSSADRRCNCDLVAGNRSELD